MKQKTDTCVHTNSLGARAFAVNHRGRSGFDWAGSFGVVCVFVCGRDRAGISLHGCMRMSHSNHCLKTEQRVLFALPQEVHCRTQQCLTITPLAQICTHETAHVHKEVSQLVTMQTTINNFVLFFCLFFYIDSLDSKK